MTLQPAEGIRQVLLRSIAPALVFLIAEIIDHLVPGEHIYPHLVTVGAVDNLRFEQIFVWGGLATAFLGGLFLALSTGAIAAYLPWRLGHRVFVLWLFLYLVAGVCVWSEYYIFSTEKHSVVVGAAIKSAGWFLLLALLIALLFPPRRTDLSLGDDLRSLLARKRWFSWVWRVALGIVAYIVLYFSVGTIFFIYYTAPYYTDPAYRLKLTLPSWELAFGLQFPRAFVYVLAVFFVLSGLRLRKAKQALLIGLALWVVGALTPLFVAEHWPGPLYYHAVEIFFQNFPAGVVFAYLLGVGPERMAGPESH